MRPSFVTALTSEMRTNKEIFVLLGDLGFGLFDSLRSEFPNRCINVGSSEQLIVGMAVGLALEEKIPICYSISSFMIYRPFEFIRNYLEHEGIPVKLVGSGRDQDYGDAGFTHHSDELMPILSQFQNIQTFWPTNSTELSNSMSDFLYSDKPAFMSLKR